MPKTDTAFNFCDAVIRLEDENGLDVNISGSSNECTFDISNEIGKFAVFGYRWYGKLECKSDAKITIKILTTTADSEAYAILKAWLMGDRGLRRVKFFSPNEETGSDIWQASCLLENANGLGGAANTAEPGMITLDLQPHYGVAHNTVGS